MKLSLAILLLSSAASANGEATYEPGKFTDNNTLNVEGKKMLYLSNGLMGEAIAHSDQPVVIKDADGNDVTVKDEAGNDVLYHKNCDGGAAIPKPDGDGYYYVSNSEIGTGDNPPDSLTGGTYSLEFDKDHNFIGYEKILGNTAKNCHGGETPWGSFVSCEEDRARGRCWQVDPAAKDTSKSVVTAVTGQTEDTPLFGQWEAFAWDADDNKGYVTNDDYPDNPGFPDGSAKYSGAIVQFTPDAEAEKCLMAETAEGKWCALDSGTVKYLHLTPDGVGSTGSFKWVDNKEEANPELYGGSEGAHVEDGIFTFSTIVDRYLFRLKLNEGTYTRSAVPFPFEPDNLRVLKNGKGGDTVYLCTDGDDQPGDAVWGWDDTGAFRMLYEEEHSYPAGVDFSTDKKNMYVSLYGHTTYRFWRSDGMGFDEPALSTKYEVMGGIDAGKTHADIFQEYNKVYDYKNPADIAVESDKDDGATATNGDADKEVTATNGDHAEEDHAEEDHAEEEADGGEVAVESTESGAASNAVAAGSTVVAIAGALIL